MEYVTWYQILSGTFRYDRLTVTLQYAGSKSPIPSYRCNRYHPVYHHDIVGSHYPGIPTSPHNICSRSFKFKTPPALSVQHYRANRELRELKLTIQLHLHS